MGCNPAGDKIRLGNKMPSSTATAKRIATTQTHIVTNQARLWKNFNFYRADPSLQRAMAAYQVDNPQIDTINRFGAKCGELMDAAERAEKNVPKLKQFDQYGEHIIFHVHNQR